MGNFKDTNPTQLAKCIILSGGDHKAGVLLDRIAFWRKYARAKIPKIAGLWNANNHEWWMRETQLSRDQLARMLKRLEKMELIEREQFWFGSRNILHVRPSQTTIRFLEDATTWEKAKTLIETKPTTLAEVLGVTKSNGSKLAHPGLAKSPGSKETSKIAELGFAETTASKDIETNLSSTEKHSGAASASPSCAAPENNKETQEEERASPLEELKNDQLLRLPAKYPKVEWESLLGPYDPTLIATAWASAVRKYWSGSLSAGDVSDQISTASIRELMQGLALWVDSEVDAANVVAFAIRHWNTFRSAGYLVSPFPAVKSLAENADFAHPFWDEGGKPHRETSE